MRPSPTDVMLWSSVASSAAVILLVAITAYYAWYVKRQADATRSQADAANKQSEVVQQGLNILVEQQRQQRETDISRVKFQLETGIQTLDGWKERLSGNGFPQLPAHPAEVRPVNFLDATKSADGVDPGVAALMQTALYFITEAEITINLLGTGSHNGNGYHDDAWTEVRDRAVNALNVARSKLDDARTRLDGLRRFA